MTKCALTYRRAPPYNLRISSYRPPKLPAVPDIPPRPATRHPHRCAAGEGVLRLVPTTRNPLFEERCTFYDIPDFPHVPRVLG